MGTEEWRKSYWTERAAVLGWISQGTLEFHRCPNDPSLTKRWVLLLTLHWTAGGCGCSQQQQAVCGSGKFPESNLAESLQFCACSHWRAGEGLQYCRGGVDWGRDALAVHGHIMGWRNTVDRNLTLSNWSTCRLDQVSLQFIYIGKHRLSCSVTKSDEWERRHMPWKHRAGDPNLPVTLTSVLLLSFDDWCMGPTFLKRYAQESETGCLCCFLAFTQ